MKVLLLGEYSGYFFNLKKGLQEAGVDCTLAASGDGWKKISGADIELFGEQRNNKLQVLFSSFIHPIMHLRKLFGFDVVYMVGPGVFPRQINMFMIKAIKRHSKSMYISVAGDCNSLYQSYVNGELEYYTYTDNPEACRKHDSNSKTGMALNRQEDEIYRLVDGIIPIMYEYAVGLKKYPNKCETIPLPFDASKIEYCENKIDGKIRIMHGVIKEKYKGTDIILQALKIIEQRHPNEVEIIVDGKMPLNEYLEKLKGINILVDQCKEHCYGLNALYAMAEGRIVLGGASENSLKEFGLSSCPVIHIEPNVDMIVDRLETLITQKHLFPKLGKESREYVEKMHNHLTIAQKYISLWEKNLIEKEIG